MQFSRKDLGYSVYSRLEEALRFWIKDRLLVLFGPDWRSSIPSGLWTKAYENSAGIIKPEDTDDPLVLLEETDIPDLMDIVCYKNSFNRYIGTKKFTVEEFRRQISNLYRLRNKIAHVKLNFSAVDLDLLLGIANTLSILVEPFETELRTTLTAIHNNPSSIVAQIPSDFIISEEPKAFAYLNNLPISDYDPDGGFIGRKEDLGRIENFILGDVHTVVTISGAGGVGKTAVAHHLSSALLERTDFPFSALIWVSAKEEKLTATGIERIEPTFRTYEEVLDSILETMGWLDNINDPIETKEHCVTVILRANDKGILLVVDNLETITDDRVIEFIKEIPPPNKVLITSRLGLGEVERRWPIKEMSRADAVVFFRTLAKEKNVEHLAMLPDDIIFDYCDRMSRYPLAIKWVIGQVALGHDITTAIGGLTASASDVTKFCFEHIFESLLNDETRLVLFALALHDKPLSRGVLSHVTDLEQDALADAVQKLTVASLIITSQVKLNDLAIETRYQLLPLTTNYIRAKLSNHAEIYRVLHGRIRLVQDLLEEGEKAGKTYRYSLQDMGATTEEERVAAMWALTAHQKYISGDYEGATEAFKRSSEISPNFPTVYRNWAMMEAQAGFQDRAEELMRKATQINSKDPRLWFSWGNIEKDRQRYDKAREYLRKALELSPDDPPILGALGEVEKRSGFFELAGILFVRSIKSTNARWNHIVCFTSLADNLRRWAEALHKEKDFEGQLAKLKYAYQAAQKAVELGGDYTASITLREVSLDLGSRIGLDVGREYVEAAIAERPRKTADKRTTQRACYALASYFLKKKEIEKAKHYYTFGRKWTIEGTRMAEAYRELGAEISKIGSRM